MTTPSPPARARPPKGWIIAGVVAAVVVVLVAAGVAAYLFVFHKSSPQQITLPFTGLNIPDGVAVDSAGNLYVTDGENNRVVKLAAGSPTQAVLPFTGLNYPDGVAVDSASTLYVTDGGNNRVLKLAAGSPAQTVLPFTGLNRPTGWPWTAPATSTSPTVRTIGW